MIKLFTFILWVIGAANISHAEDLFSDTWNSTPETTPSRVAGCVASGASKSCTTPSIIVGRACFGEQHKPDPVLFHSEAGDIIRADSFNKKEDCEAAGRKRFEEECPDCRRTDVNPCSRQDGQNAPACEECEEHRNYMNCTEFSYKDKRGWHKTYKLLGSCQPATIKCIDR